MAREVSFISSHRSQCQGNSTKALENEAEGAASTLNLIHNVIRGRNT